MVTKHFSFHHKKIRWAKVDKCRSRQGDQQAGHFHAFHISTLLIFRSGTDLLSLLTLFFFILLGAWGDLFKKALSFQIGSDFGYDIFSRWRP